MAKIKANFCENQKNHAKIRQKQGIKSPAQRNYTVYKIQHLVLMNDDHHYMQCKVFICKILWMWSIN